MDLLRRAEEEREKARETMMERVREEYGRRRDIDWLQSTVPDGRVALSEEAQTLRWFILPIEVNLFIIRIWLIID